MREIKFRVWDKLNKKMLNVNQINWFENNNKFDLILESDDEEIDTDFNLMQYTGMKDKNDKDIYEGDICKFYDTDNLLYVVEYDNELASYIFTYNKFMSMPFRYYKSKDMEVVGNICEDAELLQSMKPIINFKGE